MAAQQPQTVAAPAVDGLVKHRNQSEYTDLFMQQHPVMQGDRTRLELLSFEPAR